jgi:1,4-dihydroxy-2-naphthoate octaprenyltransferase
MFGFGGDAPAADLLQATQIRPATIFYLVLCSVVTWFMPHTAKFLEKTSGWKIALSLILLAVSVRLLYTQGANPFLYFQF